MIPMSFKFDVEFVEVMKKGARERGLTMTGFIKFCVYEVLSGRSRQ